MVVQTFGFVGNSDMPSFVRVELRVERGFLFRLSGRELLKKVVATCSPREARRYFSRVSGPFADRFGVHIELGEVLNGRENNQKLINFEEFREILPQK